MTDKQLNPQQAAFLSAVAKELGFHWVAMFLAEIADREYATDEPDPEVSKPEGRWVPKTERPPETRAGGGRWAAFDLRGDGFQVFRQIGDVSVWDQRFTHWWDGPGMWRGLPDGVGGGD